MLSFFRPNPLPMKKAIFLLCLVFMSFVVSAQYVENYEPERPTTIVKLGLGLGLDYGGIGTRLTITPTSHFGVFIAVGYNLHKAGFNGGLTYKFLPEKKVTPVAQIMYGYNAVIVVEGAEQYNKTYYGVSFGGGVEVKTRKSGNYWSFELLYPFRSSEYEDDWDALKNDPSIEITSEPLPITFSVGYHFSI